MAARIRLTKPTLAVLDVLLHAGLDENVWGLRICEQADLGSGTVYPILERLSAAGWVESRWETAQPAGRPRRRYYQVTSTGRAEAATALAARTARHGRRTRLAEGGIA
jgi:DNA-binding PadR family transcriptional regulator